MSNQRVSLPPISMFYNSLGGSKNLLDEISAAKLNSIPLNDTVDGSRQSDQVLDETFIPQKRQENAKRPIDSGTANLEEIRDTSHAAIDPNMTEGAGEADLAGSKVATPDAPPKKNPAKRSRKQATKAKVNEETKDLYNKTFGINRSKKIQSSSQEMDIDEGRRLYQEFLAQMPPRDLNYSFQNGTKERADPVYDKSNMDFSTLNTFLLSLFTSEPNNDTVENSGASRQESVFIFRKTMLQLQEVDTKLDNAIRSMDAIEKRAIAHSDSAIIGLRTLLDQQSKRQNEYEKKMRDLSQSMKSDMSKVYETLKEVANFKPAILEIYSLKELLTEHNSKKSSDDLIYADIKNLLLEFTDVKKTVAQLADSHAIIIESIERDKTASDERLDQLKISDSTLKELRISIDELKQHVSSLSISFQRHMQQEEKCDESVDVKPKQSCQQACLPRTNERKLINTGESELNLSSSPPKTGTENITLKQELNNDSRNIPNDDTQAPFRISYPRRRLLLSDEQLSSDIVYPS
ncbi:hypothetical protein V1511DRAFT_511537 [Dipodascopsis uninucleata]